MRYDPALISTEQIEKSITKINALASPAALLPLLGATIADLISLRAVFAVSIAAAAIQLSLLRTLRTADET